MVSRGVPSLSVSQFYKNNLKITLLLLLLLLLFHLTKLQSSCQCTCEQSF